MSERHKSKHAIYYFIYMIYIIYPFVAGVLMLILFGGIGTTRCFFLITLASKIGCLGEAGEMVQWSQHR